ncbi:MAG: class I SAM-dependent methyltransferase [Actinomycetota bacterium]|nr:class I SAM-dependent methyltransferase [Actinomycetota bacterium]
MKHQGTETRSRAGKVDVLSFETIRGWVARRPDGTFPTVDVAIDGLVVRTVRPIFRLETARGGFKFRIHRSLARYVAGPGSIELLVDGVPLPVASSEVPASSSAKPVAELRELLGSGYFVNKKGRLQRAIDQDVEWQEKTFDFYSRARETFRELFGYDLHITYGTLLGYGRGRDFVPGDDDFDTAYLSRHTDAASVRAELLEIVCTLLARGQDVRVFRRNLFHWHGPDGAIVDVFPSWIEGRDYFMTFAVGGPHAHVFEAGYEEVELKGRPVLVPRDVEGALEAIYGPEWRVPDPLFQWAVQPTAQAAMHAVSLDDLELARVHWTRFYGQDRGVPQPSPFATWVAERLPESLRTVIELGCGNGRDTAAVAQGRSALGLDYSPTAIERNREVWAESSIDFEQVDVSDAESLATATAGRFDDGPVAVYSRFFIHAISDEAEATLLGFLRRALPAGSVVYLEFRTEKDKNTPKVFGEHYRRFVDPDALVKRMRRGGHFALEHSERGHGLAVYKDEDPFVARLVLVKQDPWFARFTRGRRSTR